MVFFRSFNEELQWTADSRFNSVKMSFLEDEEFAEDNFLFDLNGSIAFLGAEVEVESSGDQQVPVDTYGVQPLIPEESHFYANCLEPLVPSPADPTKDEAEDTSLQGAVVEEADEVFSSGEEVTVTLHHVEYCESSEWIGTAKLESIPCESVELGYRSRFSSVLLFPPDVDSR